MHNVSATVLSTVNAPYGTALTADELATILQDPASVERFDASAFAFFSEVSEYLQRAFITEMGLDATEVAENARRFAELAGYDLPLASIDDYDGMSPAEWSTMVRKHVEDNFGPIPDDLVPVGEPAW
jgi:hypothetical protein